MRETLVLIASLLISLQASAAEIAITMDDFHFDDAPTMSALDQDKAILKSFSAHNIKAAIFVETRNLKNPVAEKRLMEWDKKNQLIANHTDEHPSYNKTSFEKFSQNVLKAEAILKSYSNFQKFFRFPYLKAGNTKEKRDLIRKFLSDHGYRNGYVTIDASDWYVNQRLLDRLKKDPKADISPFRNYYLGHLWDRATYYDSLAQKVLGRSVKHTLLVHHNLLNALFMDDVLKMFESKGWKPIDAQLAFSDPVFKAEPDIVPDGESIIWALAKETGKFESELRYPGEDDIYEKPKMDALGL